MEKLLPIGSVVLLSEASKKIMVIGYMPQVEDKQVYDYIGVIFPEGYISPDTQLLFNHSQIANIYFRGYIDAEEEEFYKNFDAMREQFLNRNNDMFTATSVREKGEMVDIEML